MWVGDGGGREGPAGQSSHWAAGQDLVRATNPGSGFDASGQGPGAQQ